MEHVFLFAVAGCACSMSLVPIASSIARKVGLVDSPNFRKKHVGIVPLSGGIVLFVSLLVAALFLPKSLTALVVICLCIPLFVLGASDDRFDLSVRLRIFGQLAVGILLIFAFDVKIVELDSVIDGSVHTLGNTLAALFTLVCFIGVLNATNMADGIDGLLGFIASVSLAGIGIMAFLARSMPEALLSFFVLGLLAGYLLFNLGAFGSKRKVFLGDSGSMIVGLVLFTLLVDLSQKDAPVFTPTSAGWLLGLPLLDTVSVMVRRLMQGRSPFTAGRDHFHHVLQDLGMSRKSTLVTLVGIQLVFVSIAFYANQVSISQSYFFWGFVGLIVLQYVGISSAVRYLGSGCLSEQGVDPGDEMSVSVGVGIETSEFPALDVVKNSVLPDSVAEPKREKKKVSSRDETMA